MGQAGKQSGSDQANAVQLFFRLRLRLCFRLGRSCNGSIFYALQLYVIGLVGILRRYVCRRFRFCFRLCFLLMGSGGKTGGDQSQAVQFFFRLRFRFGAQLGPVQSGGQVRIRLFLFFRFRLRIRLSFCLRLVGGGEESGGDQAQTGGSAQVRGVGLVIRGKGIFLRSAGQGAQRGHFRGQGVHVHVVRIRKRFRQTLVRRALVQPLVAGDQLRRKAGDLLPFLIVGGRFVKLDQGFIAAAIYQLSLGVVRLILLFLTADKAEASETGKTHNQTDYQVDQHLVHSFSSAVIWLIYR